MSSLIGRRLGRYEIRAELGRGGMARVYRAVDTQLQRTVALKLLAVQLSMDEEFVRRFEREATTAANLRHPAIVTVYDVGEQDGLHYIAMEFVSGRSLHSILEERTALGLGFAISLLEPVAQALDYAHSQGAVHRDIKPHNILLDQSGRVLLTDFGIAQTTDADSERLTRTGVFMGTPEYISPEQAEARRVDGRSDLYSLGVVAYEIVTGRVPFAGATPQLIVAHSQLPPPPPSTVAPYLPGELDTVLAKALAKRPERRYPSGAALVAALREVAERYDTPLATRDQLAALSAPSGTPDSAEARSGVPPLPPPRPPPPRERPVPSVRPPPPRERPVPSVRPPPPPERPVPPLPRAAEGPTRVQTEGSRPGSGGPRSQGQNQARGTARPPPYPPDRTRQRPAGGVPLALIGLIAVAILLIFVVFAVARGLATAPARTPLPTATQQQPILQASLVAITPTAPPPSDTPAPTTAPSQTPSELTPIAPTNTLVPPTRAAAPPTPIPPTAEPPTAEPPSPIPPTAEPPTAEPPTAEPPTAEPPSPTLTAALPTITATNTPLLETPVLSETPTVVTAITTG